MGFFLAPAECCNIQLQPKGSLGPKVILPDKQKNRRMDRPTTGLRDLDLVASHVLLFMKFLLSSPSEARAFNVLRRYHTRPLRFSLEPENVLITKIEINTSGNFFLGVFHYGTSKRPTNGSKTQKLPKNDQIIIPTWRTSHKRTHTYLHNFPIICPPSEIHGLTIFDCQVPTIVLVYVNNF